MLISRNSSPKRTTFQVPTSRPSAPKPVYLLSENDECGCKWRTSDQRVREYSVRSRRANQRVCICKVLVHERLGQIDGSRLLMRNRGLTATLSGMFCTRDKMLRLAMP